MRICRDRHTYFVYFRSRRCKMAAQDCWNQPCADAHLIELSQLIARWREIAPVLGLTETDEEDIKGHYPDSPPAQRIAMLRTWSKIKGSDATYARLATAFQQCNRNDLLEKISELIAAEESACKQIASNVFANL